MAAGTSPGLAQNAEPRLALVIGNSQYTTPLATPANDAGLVAQTLQAAGFDVTGAADLGGAALRQSFNEFLDKVRQAGPGAIVFVYLAGRGVQYAGDNYFVPIDAAITRDVDVPTVALRVSDYTHALEGLSLKAGIFVLDAARGNDYARAGAPLAGGLALVDAAPGTLVAFNAAPGTVAPDEQGPYGVYAQALVEMMHQGFSVNEAFREIRLRVNQLSRGATIPWDSSKIDMPVFFFQRAAGAPALERAPDLNKSLRNYPVQEAYAIAIDRDTIAGYQEFLAAYGSDPLASRIRALLAARREALTWRRALEANSPAAFWTYMRRYPHGPHFYDARRRLTLLSAPLDPPPRFDPYDFADLPPPPEAEYAIVDRPVVIFDAPDYPPPPPPPVFILPERPREFVDLPPPPEHHDEGILPIPAPIPVPFSRPAVNHPGAINPPRISQQQPSPQPNQGGQQPSAAPQGHQLPGPGQKPQAQPGTPATGGAQSGGFQGQQHAPPAAGPAQGGGFAPQPASPQTQPSGPQHAPQSNTPHTAPPPSAAGPAQPERPVPQNAPAHTPAPSPTPAAPHAAPAAPPEHAAPPAAPHTAPAAPPEHAAPPAAPHAAPAAPPEHAAPPAPPHAAPAPPPQHAAPPPAPHAAPPAPPPQHAPAPAAPPHAAPAPQPQHAPPQAAQPAPHPAPPAQQHAAPPSPPHPQPGPARPGEQKPGPGKDEHHPQ